MRYNITHVGQYSARYTFNQLERLLDQAADLLERGLKSADQADDLDAKRVDFEVASDEFRAFDEIEQREQDAGKYSHVDQAASSEAGALDAENAATTAKQTALQQVIDYLQNNAKDWENSAGKVVWDKRLLVDMRAEPSSLPETQIILATPLYVTKED